MELKDTVEMMNSEDYKERFRAEYFQTLIRINKLKTTLRKHREGELTFEPKCSYQLLRAQVKSMQTYVGILEERARIEHIKLF